MNEYKLLAQGVLEPLSKFEKRLNAICDQGWRPVSLTDKEGRLVVLLSKVDRQRTY
jgi:hypothetical protein